MGSTRLPGKVLFDLGGETVLARVVHRLNRSALIHEVVVATTAADSDQAIVEESARLGVAHFRGPEQDVLDRYYGAARVAQADVIVRITSDCPLIDPKVVDLTIRAFVAQGADYASSSLERTYPRGLDTEVFTFAALERASSMADQPHEREHVTPFFYEHPGMFKIVSVKGETDYSRYRWALDTPEDLRLIRTIYSRVANRDTFAWTEIIKIMENEPDLAKMNAHIVQKPVL